MIPWLLSSDHSTEETLPSSPCARYHAGECDSHSPVSDEYSGCKIKGRDIQSYARTFNISSQNNFPNFYICTRGHSRSHAEPLHHDHWMPQLSTITAEQPQPPLPQQQDAKHPFYSRTTKPLSYLPSFPSFPSHHTKPLTCSFSQQCPPHTEQPRHSSIFKQQLKLCKQDQIAPGNIPLG